MLMVFILNKFFIFFCFFYKRKLVQFLQLKNYFLYFLILFFRPSTALCEENPINTVVEVDNSSTSTKKIIFYSLLALTLLGIGVFYYYYSGNNDYPSQSDSNFDIEAFTNKLNRETAIAESKAMQESLKIAERLAYNNWVEASMQLSDLEKQGASSEEIQTAVINMNEALTALREAHVINPHIIYRTY